MTEADEWRLPDGWRLGISRSAQGLQVTIEVLPPRADFGGPSRESLSLSQAEEPGVLEDALRRLVGKAKKRAEDRALRDQRAMDIEQRFEHVEERIRALVIEPRVVTSSQVVSRRARGIPVDLDKVDFDPRPDPQRPDAG